jgi:hypothetical protein
MRGDPLPVALPDRRRRRFMTAFAGLIDAPDARREMPDHWHFSTIG